LGEGDAKAERRAFANLDRWSGSSMVVNALEVNPAQASFGLRRFIAAFLGAARKVGPRIRA
jgi:hypothetical protein